MHAPNHTGYLLLADISGFDAYLANVELDHANDVLKELLELVVDSLSPPMQIASIHQDAVLAYQLQQEVSRGEGMLELTEATYMAFRDRLKSIARNNTCDCRACQAVPTLDLKFLVHYGEFSTQEEPGGRVSLGGLDAGLVRERRLKDQVKSGSRSYALFTESGLQQMGVSPEEMTPCSGDYDHVGIVQSRFLDLGRRYEALTDARRAYISAEEADVIVSYDFAAAPALVWEWLNDPTKRTRWFRWTTWTPGLRPGGRTGVGAVNHCVHGVGSLIETILDWRPYQYFTVEMRQDSMSSAFEATYQLAPLPDGQGTHLEFRAILRKAPVIGLARPVFRAGYSRKLKQDFVRMAALMAEA
ncbi:MAG: DUF2652 domain-containing protein [Chloroflexota bacterium]|jgi:uncharacterized protein YndB with AHSA1/START domain